MRLIADFHDETAARHASEEFRRVFTQHGVPDEIEAVRYAAEDGKAFLPKLLVTLGLASSNSDAGRLIAQGGVRIDDVKVDPSTRDIDVEAGATHVIKVGKRHFARVVFE